MLTFASDLSKEKNVKNVNRIRKSGTRVGHSDNSGGGTDEGRRETGQHRGRRREIMTGEKGGVIGREKGELTK